MLTILSLPQENGGKGREKIRMKRCVFFDRDGIVNGPPAGGYLQRWEDFELLPGFVNVLRTARALGYEAIVASNQRGVALGVMTREAVEEIHRRLRDVLMTEYELELLDVFYCPHDDDECECRKPKPGMLLEAARRHDIDLKSSWVIGDQERDVEAGRQAGCRTILVDSGESETKADLRVSSMDELQTLVAGVLAPGAGA